MLNTTLNHLPEQQKQYLIEIVIDNFSPEPSLVFPRNTKEEKDLFTVLKNSYVDSRYNEQYKIAQEIAHILLNRAVLFLSVAKRIYQEKLLSLDEGIGFSLPIKADD